MALSDGEIRDEVDAGGTDSDSTLRQNSCRPLERVQMPFYLFSVNSFSQQLNAHGQPHCDESTAHFEHSFTTCNWSPQSLHS